ncbi:MAG TPA: MFS transporter [Streptomyces sp.]
MDENTRIGTRTTSPSAWSPEAGPRAAATLLVTCAATLLVLMDYTAPMTTLPETAAALDSGLSGQTWILNGMPLGLAALLLVAGSLADGYGRKRVFLIGTAVLVAGLAVSAAATNTALFVVTRMVQGGASAAILATSLALVAHAFPPGPGRIRATGLWGATLGAGIALGPVISAALSTLSWGACYWVFAGATGLVGVVAGRVLVDSRSDQPGRPDLVGVATLGLGLVAMMAGLTESRGGWLRTPVVVLLAMAALLLVAFTIAQARRRDPLLDLGLFRRPLFLTATLGALFTGVAVIGLMSYLPTVIQLGLGLSPLGTAGLFVIWSGLSAIVALQARRLAPRMSARQQLALGLVVSAAGTLSMLGSIGAGPWSRLIPGLVVSGAGSGLINAALARLAVDSVPATHTAMGAGANNTARYVGSAVGVAVMVAVMTASSSNSGGAHGLGHGTDVALVLAAGLAGLGAVLCLALRDGERRRRSDPRDPRVLRRAGNR